MLYLASRSPRRAELLRQIGLEFEIIDGAVDESQRPGESALQMVERLAVDKALAGLAVFDRMPPGDHVLAADTLIALDGEIIGKPGSLTDCERILQILSGRQHEVLSAVALAGTRGLIGARVSRNQVQFADLTGELVRRYCAGGEPLDKAGAYAIQGMAAIFIKQITGSYSAIMGLPLYETAGLLEHAGYHLMDKHDQ
jgi:septum formation protein